MADSASTLLVAALVALASASLGCTHERSRRAPQYPVPAAQAGYGRAGAPATGRTETFHGASPRQPASAYLTLPGARSPELVRYDIVDGMAVMDGDIVLGPASTLGFRSSAGGDRMNAAAVANRFLWPGAVIPYELDPSVSSMVADIQWAIDHVNETQLQLRPRTASDVDYVVFRDSADGGCSAQMGRAGGAQFVNVAPACRGPGTLHEIMHAAGFLHEHQRADRDAYISIVWDEIEPGREQWFGKRNVTEQDLGPYDYASIMHYGVAYFSKRGNPTIVPHVANAPIGQREGLSALDRAGIATLYGAAGKAPAPSLPPSLPGLPPIAWPVPSMPSLPSSVPSLPFPIPDPFAPQ